MRDCAPCNACASFLGQKCHDQALWREIMRRPSCIKAPELYGPYLCAASALHPCPAALPLGSITGQGRCSGFSGLDLRA